MWFRKKQEYEPSTFYQDWYKEQIARIRQGEPIMWLPGTPVDIRLRSLEIDRLNAKLDEQATR
jgi:hypothetical protein